jgi:hypothetical protein
MEGQGTGSGLTGTAQIKESGDDGSAKPLPPCCVKARAAALSLRSSAMPPSCRAGSPNPARNVVRPSSLSHSRFSCLMT